MDNSALTQYLDKHRRAVQLKQLGILKEIDAICSRNHIDYWLDGAPFWVRCVMAVLFLGTMT